MWYHDHTLGMTRLNVYAGPAGFYLLRGGPDDEVTGTLPSPAPAAGDTPGTTYYEIPLAIQDRSFNADGSLFYPDNRAFFEGLEPEDLDIPFIPETACDGKPSDVSPIWNPGVLRRRDGRQRALLAVLGGGAAPLSPAHPQRL